MENLNSAQWMDLIKQFYDLLEATQKLRNKLNFLAPNDIDEKELAWVLLERTVMFIAVNNKRLSNNLPPLSLKDFKMKIEYQASGHYDYTHKFALYCAENSIR